MNNKHLLAEIDLWEADGTVDGKTADLLRSRYPARVSKGILMTVFAIAGSLLIGAGVILILASNWYRLPTAVKAFLGVLPLLVGQGLAIYTVTKKYDRAVWRESVALFWCAGVFAALAMIGQSFHLSNDFAVYILSCGLLCLPIIYLLDAVSPLVVYYYTVFNWGFLLITDSSMSPLYALPLLAMYLGGLFYTLKCSKTGGAKYIYSVWISVIAAFCLSLSFMGVLESGIRSIIVFFVLLFAMDTNSSRAMPFKPVGTVGILILAIIYSCGIIDESVGTISAVVCGALLLLSLLLGITSFKKDVAKIAFIAAGCVLYAISFVSDYNRIAAAVAANILTLIIALCFIVRGARRDDIAVLNVGLVTFLALIVLRFFDTKIDFLTKGVAFLVLGGVFLLVNVRLAKRRKQKAIVPEIENGGDEE